MKQRLIQFLLWVDYRTDGIRLRLFVAAAVVQVFLAPLWDQYLPFERVAARMEPMTLLATLAFLLIAALLLGGRLVALSSQDDGADERSPVRSARRLLTTALRLGSRYWRLARLEPWPSFLARLGAGLCVTLMALRGATGLCRWALWKAMRLTEHVLSTGELATPRAALTWVYRQEQWVLKWVVLSSIPLAVLAAWAFLRKSARDDLPTALRDLRALAGVDPVLERRAHDQHDEIYSAFNGDLLHRVLRDLATWEPTEAIDDEQSCRDDIAFFLRTRGYQVAIERWIETGTERRRVDLLVENSIPIEMKYALHEKGAGERDRARSQVECYARMWGNVGPVLLLLAATPRKSAADLGQFATSWNANLDGRRAPLLILTDSSDGLRGQGRLLAS